MSRKESSGTFCNSPHNPARRALLMLMGLATPSASAMVSHIVSVCPRKWTVYVLNGARYSRQSPFPGWHSGWGISKQKHRFMEGGGQYEAQSDGNHCGDATRGFREHVPGQWVPRGPQILSSRSPVSHIYFVSCSRSSPSSLASVHLESQTPQATPSCIRSGVGPVLMLLSVANSE
jgi:hypothetical protein